ncbi:DUF438 domain-containing protein [Thermohalobacter berrensis]|uniref:Histidine kinase n=1 Tax=Thermohalobacter berrensis TaxID=99594 RepID=A0A419SW74_9FIRM|nr:DUF438 domain-containing protein [Thermohalobacter berrensis]RKD29493.1 histidine kinase [Thermohalobacter berrensis]
MNKIDKLTEILEKLNSGEITEDIRKEAIELVSRINPLELSLAEQKLIEKGMKPEDLRNLCEIHMEVLKDELVKLKKQIDQGHVLDILIKEHDEILKYLNELEIVNNKIQTMKSFAGEKKEFTKLKYLADRLLETEKHHQREEDVLFIQMEERKITGPTRIMRMEHDDLRERKQLIKELSENVSKLDFKEFKTKLDEAVKYIIFNLRDHIFKENYILYPTALEAIKDPKKWQEMKRQFDKIGYCSFTPTY